MLPIREGYDFAAVNFGGYQLCRTMAEAESAAANMVPIAGEVYTRGFFSERLQQWVGKDKWFPAKKII